MTDTTQLDTLIAAVEAGDATFDTDAFDDLDQQVYVVRAYTGSLDAALALHKALVSEHFVQIKNWAGEGRGAIVKVGAWHIARNKCPARAWLLSILKAYRAQSQHIAH